MIFDLMATNGGGVKYFTKDGVIYTDLICDDGFPYETYTWLTVEDGRLKWRTKNTQSGIINTTILGVENIDLSPYKKIVLTIPEYEGGYWDAENPVGISGGNELKVYVLKKGTSRPPYHNTMYSNPRGALIEKSIHPKNKLFEIDISDINEVCQIWLGDAHSASSPEHVLYITEFGVK